MGCLFGWPFWAAFYAIGKLYKEKSMSILLKNGQVIDHHQLITQDILIDNGVIQDKQGQI